MKFGGGVLCAWFFVPGYSCLTIILISLHHKVVNILDGSIFTGFTINIVLFANNVAGGNVAKVN